ncbi:mandelate racemase/muconate lactonizing enzyme family protein [Enterovirga sp.]|uniref:mandelate racemase/muconate lactonizing enzyme family protein n=1 Tax=Enterovirga sp. TaxID=2026350 RepID=UPI0026050B23|nr:mandelate racemase/muconate lactonizing enzyme family protein [Enterovirga sp.]MDB5592532.1 putative mandelate racemase/muconate lactonizing enzyme [Enterovirga sp.]
MRISRVEVYALRAPKQERPHWTSHFIVPQANELLVRLFTDEGIDGFGLATSYTPIDYALKPWTSGLADLIVGEDALAPERLYAKLFGLTTSKMASERGWSKEAMVRISAAVDIACWDIVGKAARLPLFRLFGGFRDEVPAYVTCGYYREGKDNHELRDEMQMLVGQGHTGFKAKAGGIPVPEDIDRMALMREVIGPDCDFMVDPNRAWDLPTAIEAARLLEPLNPRWLEEPVRWEDDRRGLKLLAQKTRIPLSGGESEITSYGCRALLEEQAIQILQFDCTMMGGFTEGRKLAGLCELNHVQIAPHHDCFIHAHIVAASPAGAIVESFTDPERDPLQAELFEDPPAIKAGRLKLKEQPGLGLTLSEAAVAKFGQRVL